MKLFASLLIATQVAADSSGGEECAPDGWKDMYGNLCESYSRNKMCRLDYEDYAADGYHSAHCKECGCGAQEEEAEEEEEAEVISDDGCAPDGWKDMYDNNCAYYLANGMCDPRLDYESYAADGYHSQHCKECGCGAEEEEVDDVASPCPSTECWTYDADTHTCSMTGTCATLSCDSTQFDITFSSELFNLDTQSPGTFAGGLAPTWDGSMWSLTTPLGDSGMTYDLNAERHDITFSLPLIMVGNEMRERSDDVQDNVIVLGSQSIVTTPFGASIVFTCTYDLTVEVASEDYTVAGASVVDTFTGTGSLSAGFAMSLNNGEGSAFMLGDNIQVGITWAVTTLSDLTYRIKQCDVQHGDSLITIVKDQCYAAALDVVPEDHMDQGFSYQIFKGVGETDASQKITCSVIICDAKNYCGPYSNSECPKDGDDQFYNFQMNPAHDG